MTLTDDLSARLQLALGGAYYIERELGGGGMSRLFVATERSLNRQVVVKVLPPELSSEVSAARFKQEIEVATRLQHPHVLAILAAGASGDLIYYIMPYVSGESLRHRLRDVGQLPVREAVRILDEIAGALDYAHRQGVVHRDIKPENILLQDGQAVLADFGVARAISAARTSDSTRDQSLTAAGASVGTPRYMAPEQAAGETNVGARADVYALGVVGYEMLTGQHPFAATTTQTMIVAHLTETAPSIAKLRPEIAPAIAAAITKALAKAPEDRFRTAAEFRNALESPNGKRTKRGLIAPLIAAAAIVAVGTSYLLSHRSTESKLDANLVAVAPFDVVDPDLKLWHEGMVDVLSRGLDGAGSLRSVSPTVIVHRWSGRGDRESAKALGRSTGAAYVVFGTLLRSGSDSVRGSASVVDVQSGRVLGAIERHDAQSHMDRLSDSLTVGVLRELGKTKALAGARMSSVGTTSLPALKAFLQGEQFYRRSAWDSAIAYYEIAIAADSQFSFALMREGNAIGWESSWSDSTSRAFDARAGRFNHRLSPRDSLLVLDRELFGQLGDDTLESTYDLRRRLLTTLSDAIKRYPSDPELWMAMGDAQVHFAWGRGLGVSDEEMLRSFDKAIALDSTFAPAYIHATELAFRNGAAKGRRYVSAYLSQHPADLQADAMRLVYRLTDPSTANTFETKQILDSASRRLLSYVGLALRQWPDSAETEEQLVMRQLPDDSMKPLYRADYGGVRGRLLEAWRVNKSLFEATHLALINALPNALVDSVLLANAQEPCFACSVDIWGRRGDTLKILKALRLREASPKKGKRRDHKRHLVYIELVTHAYFALAKRDTAAALREFLAIPDSLPDSYEWLTLSQLLVSQHRYTEALRALDQPGYNEYEQFVDVVRELNRARIYEAIHDKQRARDAYRFVAGMWQNGDSIGQRYVAESNAALARLGDDSAAPIPIVTDKNASH